MRYRNPRHARGQEREIDQPQAGHFKLRFVSKGWAVPCRIIRHQDSWQAEVDGTLFEAAFNPHDAPRVMRIWHSAERIEESDYIFLVTTREWAREYEPSHPSLHPDRPIDPMRLIPIPPPAHRIALRDDIII